MKKVIYSLILMISFMVLPNIVNATSLNVSITCGNIKVGETSTCTIRGTSSGNPISTIGANFRITGGTFVSFTKASGWQGDSTSSDFLFYHDTGFTGTWNIGTLKVKGSNVGTITISLTGIEGGDNVTGDMIKVGNKTATITVSSATTKTTTTTKKTTTTTKNTTTKKTTTTTKKTTTTTRTYTTPTKSTTTTRIYTTPGPTTSGTRPSSVTSSQQTYSHITSTLPTATSTSKGQITTPAQEEAKINALTVDNFEVIYQHGIYMVQVYPETESVTITASGPDGSTILGTGARNISVGQNTVELTLKMPNGIQKVYPLFITRPDPNKNADTRLRKLKVAGYDIEFNPDKKDYSITIPRSCNELYIDYETYDSDVIVVGAGLVSINKDTGTLYIKSAYGSKASTEYSITIKRSYMTIVLIVIIVLLIGGIGGMLFYYFNEKKKNNTDANNAKNKAIADENRAELAKGPQASFNGQSVVGTGRRTVLPTQVVETPPAPDPNLPAPGMPPIGVETPVMEQPLPPIGELTPIVEAPMPPAEAPMPLADAPMPPIEPAIQPIEPVPPVVPEPIEDAGVASTQIESVTPPTEPQVKVIRKILNANIPMPPENSNFGAPTDVAPQGPAETPINITEI